MFDQVVVGVDGRSGGRDAVALARALAPDGHLVLVHAPNRRNGGRADLAAACVAARPRAELELVEHSSPARALS